MQYTIEYVEYRIHIFRFRYLPLEFRPDSRMKLPESRSGKRPYPFRPKGIRIPKVRFQTGNNALDGFTRSFPFP